MGILKIKEIWEISPRYGEKFPYDFPENSHIFPARKGGGKDRKCAEDEQEGRGKGVGAREGNERGKEGRGNEKKRFLKLIVSSPRSGPKIRLMKPSPPPPWIVPSETFQKMGIR